MSQLSAYKYIGIFFFYLIQISLQAQQVINYKAYESIDIHPANWINTSFLEFSPTKYQDGIVYIASGEKQKKFDKKINESFFEIRFAGVENPDTSLISFFDELNKQPLHKGPGSFTHHDSVFYFTIENRASVLNQKSVLKIVSVSKTEDSWAYSDMPFIMMDNYSYCHPSINKAQTILVFSSNMPGGYGGMDLYMCNKTAEGWSTPINLGSQINTGENEVFPYLFEENTLFFSSDRLEGFGGLDFYVSLLDSKNAEILRSPLNSSKDDFGLLLNEDGYSGFFSSSRLDENGKDNIFQFNLNNPLLQGKPRKKIENRSLSFCVRDKENGFPLEDVKAFVSKIHSDCDAINIENFESEIFKDPSTHGAYIIKMRPIGGNKENWISNTNKLGLIKLDVSSAKPSIFILKKEGYQPQEFIINPKDDFAQKDIYLIPLINEKINESAAELIRDQEVIESIVSSFENPAPLIIEKKGAMVILNNIYYDFDKAEIKKGSTAELDALAFQMKQNPRLIIELSSHTDSRGDAGYNLALSEARAKSAKRYLTSLGVEADRINAIGYGEKFILNRCVNDVKCSEEEHLINRRTEVKVLEF